MSPSYKRPDGRAYDALRNIEITVGVSKFAEGSCEIRFGDTEVLCLATVTDSVPRHLIGKDEGWVTAEYAMLPRSTPERSQRESIAGRPGGRTFEIQRLVGRALRSATAKSSRQMAATAPPRSPAATSHSRTRSAISPRSRCGGTLPRFPWDSCKASSCSTSRTLRTRSPTPM